MHLWRNWYTRTVEVRVPKGLEVRVLSDAPEHEAMIFRPGDHCERDRNAV